MLHLSNKKCCNTFAALRGGDILPGVNIRRVGDQLRMPKSGRDRDERQLDLFDGPSARPDASPVAPVRSIDPTSLSDAELLAGFARAPMAEVEALGEEILRRRPEGWMQAALALWDRFLGFGETKPMLEQVVVLELVERTAETALLRGLLRRGPMAECLDAHFLLAAAACRLALPADVVLRGLSHGRAGVRSAAVRLAILSGVSTEQLHPYLADSAREVRRATATMLAEAGETLARDPLLFEMRVQPDRAGLEALSYVADEDVVIRLGQIARQHPAWCGIVIEVLQTIDHPMAERVAAGLSG